MEQDPNKLSALEKAQQLKQQKAAEKAAAEQEQQETEAKQLQEAQEEFDAIDKEISQLQEEKETIATQIENIRSDRLENMTNQREAVKELKSSEETEDILSEEGMKEEIFAGDDEALDELKEQEQAKKEEMQELENKIAELQEKRTEVYQKTPEGLAELEKEENDKKEKQDIYNRTKEVYENNLTRIQELRLKYQDLLDKKINIDGDITFPENQESLEQKIDEAGEEYEKSLAEMRAKEQELKSLKKGLLETSSSFEKKRNSLKSELESLQQTTNDLGGKYEDLRLSHRSHPDKPTVEIPKGVISDLYHALPWEVSDTIPKEGKINMNFGEYLDLYQDATQKALEETQTRLDELN